MVTHINYTGELNVRDSGILPHWEMDRGVYFVTFRLADALPQSVLRNLKAQYEREREIFVEAMDPGPMELAHFDLDWEIEKIDAELDKGYGECWLERRDVAELVAGALEFFHDELYRLFNWCLVSNHVHTQFLLFNGDELDDVMHKWKSYTATVANKELLDRVGEPFWQENYFDHLIRTEESFDRIAKYIHDNPAAAGLTDWEWVKSYPKHGWKPTGT